MSPTAPELPAPSLPAPRLTPATAAALAADLAALPYTTAAVEELLGPVAAAALDREHAEPARRVVAWVLASAPHDDGDRGSGARRGLAALVSVWMLGDAADAADVAAALPALGLDGAREAGLVVKEGGGTVRGIVDLSPYEADEPGRMWVASDQTALQRRGPLPEDHVLGIGRASLTLAGATQRRPVARALDVGVGCGIQTLHLLAHAEHVTATDLSERALEFTRFNLLLNADVLGLDRERLEDRVRLAAGDMLAPVAGELTQPVDEALGAAWAAAVARRDRLAEGAPDGAGDPALAALRGLHLRVAEDVSEERHGRFGAEHPEVILARQGAGFRRTARLDTATAGVLSASDGELSVGQLVGAVAALLELDDAGRAGLLAAIRELYEDGFLVEAAQ